MVYGTVNAAAGFAETSPVMNAFSDLILELSRPEMGRPAGTLPGMMRKGSDWLHGGFMWAPDNRVRGSGEPGPSDTRKEVSTMDEAIGLETEAAQEPVSNEPDTGADVQQDGEFQGEY